MKTAKDIMSTDLGTVGPYADLDTIRVLSKSLHVRHIPVVDSSKRVVGILSLWDILELLDSDNDQEEFSVNKLMSKDVRTVFPDTPIEEIARIMIEFKIGAVPVIESEKLIGIVSERDFLKVFSEKKS